MLNAKIQDNPAYNKSATLRTMMLICILFIMPLCLMATLDEYTFSHVVSDYYETSGGTVYGTNGNDEQVFNAIPLGFYFRYNSVLYNTISISSNGFIAMGDMVISSNTALSTGASNNAIAPFNRDLRSRADGELSTYLDGYPTARFFVIQWKNYRRYATQAANDILNFQIWLCETTNQILFCYGNCNIVNYALAPTVQCGLRGSSNMEFLNRTTETDWNATMPGNFNNSTCRISGTVFPPNGMTFIWDPPPMTVSFNVTPTEQYDFNLTWDTDHEMATLGFNVFRSDDDILSFDEQINPYEMPAGGDDAPHTYSFLDSTNIQVNHPYCFWLGVVRYEFIMTFYGPVIASITAQADIVSFTSSLCEDNLINLEWSAENVTGVLGFNIFRSDHDSLDLALQINNSPVPAVNTAVLTPYNYQDSENHQFNHPYFYWLQTVYVDNSSIFSDPVSIVITNNADAAQIQPHDTLLLSAYPNPFRQSVAIPYFLKTASDLKIEVYDVKGRKVYSCETTYKAAGPGNIIWNGTTKDGNRAPSGIYFYKMTTPGYMSTRKMIFAK
jgi:hypothetical protein